MALSVLIAPSILSADRERLQEEIKSIEPYADWLQIDVMDGHFVPNVTFPFEVVQMIRTSLPLDIHLMVEDPASYAQKFLQLQPKNITFHAEAVQATDDRRALMQAIRKGGALAGIAINPPTSLGAIADVLGEVDLLLVMSVNPGFGGQAFIPSVLEKVEEARRRFPQLMIQMDGGIDERTAPQCIRAGANNLVAGSFIFRASDRAKAITSLRTAL
ncbi:MAG TPA: ribulose-phosphate 3-epimerase [Candidatus Peribacter riflensis]|uniref:Ribulose-phosphate 3-epimerase n=1 Tax=Candidatus Peribacter riflensis TaxID=1735162 RepID=A0A0S1SM06_9BACT|nr:MAG: ribulose-phosphate 3-epimerase [Candidatus Peribacter riflensis]OGJ78153.1 MAG: ribulose-phosphate 3-epimerase [Candidatus Peribacteria bacterium RIFOXYB1_FULL_57_12]ALM10546.1 MAG: ribulose-phosphate 3-epimerase [Candidatus Peribacter riflensis]ALM11649.1 MAG: ribulose-phosphate 3-epimerase [Candidatus Peribacter riflensis]ALM12751.1 MAG: ribulose-phosphate 3-epimerase [Candidatus Peribacter riflensis]